MCLTIQDALSLDIDYLYGQSWSVREDDLKAHEEQINRAAKEVSEIRRNGRGRMEAMSSFRTSLIYTKKIC